MEASSQLYGPATVRLGKSRAVWAPQSVWTQWRREKFPFLPVGTITWVGGVKRNRKVEDGEERETKKDME